MEAVGLRGVGGRRPRVRGEGVERAWMRRRREGHGHGHRAAVEGGARCRGDEPPNGNGDGALEGSGSLGRRLFDADSITVGPTNWGVRAPGFHSPETNGP